LAKRDRIAPGGDGHFDDAMAERYDRDHGGTDAEAVGRVVAALARLAGDGPVLEFAVGTGRIALPLTARGLDVRGIELSTAMIRQLRRKETGRPMEIAIGDMSTTRLPGRFSLVFLVFNTIDNLTTQEAQVACFANAARHLVPGCRFVVETQVPPVQRLPFGETLRCFACEDGHLGVDSVDIATQTYVSRHVWTDATGARERAIPFRYAWPAEMDLMARLAGMTPEHRWADWDRSPFDRLSRKHVSVWRKDA
jgi:hypothetical protein